jgi:response regulator of citrate/malate metabolism
MLIIVEDLELNIFVFIKALQAYNNNYQAIGVKSIKEAKRVLSLTDDVKLVLLDHHLINESGETLAQFLDEFYPHIPYVYISTSADEHIGTTKFTRNLGKLFSAEFFEKVKQELGIDLKVDPVKLTTTLKPRP